MQWSQGRTPQQCRSPYTGLSGPDCLQPLHSPTEVEPVPCRRMGLAATAACPDGDLAVPGHVQRCIAIGERQPRASLCVEQKQRKPASFLSCSIQSTRRYVLQESEDDVVVWSRYRDGGINVERCWSPDAHAFYTDDASVELHSMRWPPRERTVQTRCALI